MENININTDALYEAGEYIGFAIAALSKGILAGIENYNIMEAASDFEEVQTKEEPLKRSSIKTNIGDCRQCWCDQCARLESCSMTKEGALPDGVRPFPCVDCENGMRFRPKENICCKDFLQGNGLNNG